MVRSFHHHQAQHKKGLHLDRISFIAVVFLILGSLVVFQLFRIQVLKSKDYLKKAGFQHKNLEEITTERGEIYWRDFYTAANELYPAAVNKNTYLIFAVPREVESVEEFFFRLEPYLSLSRDEILPLLEKKDDPYEPLREGLKEEEKEDIQKLNLKGVGFKEQTERYYPAGEILGNITGFVGFEGDKQVGRYGLEEFFESSLVGQPGVLNVEQDALGRPIGIGNQAIKEPVRGQDLALTIDRTLQFFACQKLTEYIQNFKADSGNVIIMNLNNGAIVAMCSSPNFDPNNYQNYDLKNFINPNVSYTYEPGSIMKPITISAALDLEKITPSTTYLDSGEVIIDKFKIENSDRQAHGKQTMTDVLVKSLNTGAIFAMRQMGRQNFVNYIKKFGFGSFSGIEISGEEGGDISSLDKGEIYAATASFGQGIAVTPIQMITAYTALANDGVLLKPTIAYKKEQGEPIKPQTISQVLKKKTSQTISAMLVSAVKEGYAKKAGVLGYKIAAKTGTAQIAKAEGKGYEENITIHSVIGFGPISETRKPIFLMLTKIDKPKGVRFAESTVAPLFGEIAAFLLQYYKIAPDESF